MKKKPTYYKGRWYYDEPADWCEHGFIDAPDATSFASINPPNLCFDEDLNEEEINERNKRRHATGRLLAAAPEMLEALRATLAFISPKYQPCADDPIYPLWSEVTAAIHKAETGRDMEALTIGRRTQARITEKEGES